MRSADGLQMKRLAVPRRQLLRRRVDGSILVNLRQVQRHEPPDALVSLELLIEATVLRDLDHLLVEGPQLVAFPLIDQDFLLELVDFHRLQAAAHVLILVYPVRQLLLQVSDLFLEREDCHLKIIRIRSIGVGSQPVVAHAMLGDAILKLRRGALRPSLAALRIFLDPLEYALRDRCISGPEHLVYQLVLRLQLVLHDLVARPDSSINTLEHVQLLLRHDHLLVEVLLVDSGEGPVAW